MFNIAMYALWSIVFACQIMFLYGFLLLTRNVCDKTEAYVLSEDLHFTWTIGMLSVKSCHLIIKNTC